MRIGMTRLHPLFSAFVEKGNCSSTLSPKQKMRDPARVAHLSVASMEA